jgi:broad specificity phosphatase PhoE
MLVTRVSLYLVRHGRPRVDPSLPAWRWTLDPSAAHDVRALRARLPQQAAWASSPEPKALATTGLLTDAPFTVVEELREQERGATPWFGEPDAWQALVARAFAQPDSPAYEGWETLSACRARVHRAVSLLRLAQPQLDLVLVGHGTAWCALVSALSGDPPDLELWRRLAMPDLLVLA